MNLGPETNESFEAVKEVFEKLLDKKKTIDINLDVINHLLDESHSETERRAIEIHNENVRLKEQISSLSKSSSQMKGQPKVPFLTESKRLCKLEVERSTKAYYNTLHNISISFQAKFYSKENFSAYSRYLDKFKAFVYGAINHYNNVDVYMNLNLTEAERKARVPTFKPANDRANLSNDSLSTDLSDGGHSDSIGTDESEQEDADHHLTTVVAQTAAPRTAAGSEPPAEKVTHDVPIDHDILTEATNILDNLDYDEE